MFVQHRLPSQFGPVLPYDPRPIEIPTDPGQALDFAARIDRQADALLAEGQFRRAARA